MVTNEEIEKELDKKSEWVTKHQNEQIKQVKQTIKNHSGHKPLTLDERQSLMIIEDIKKRTKD